MPYDELKSEWNFAIAYFQRLDRILQNCNYLKTVRSFEEWLLNVIALDSEMSPRMKVERQKDGTYIDEKKEAEKLQADAIHKVSLHKQKVNIDSWIIFHSINRYENFLRDLIRRRGMDLPSSKDPSHALLNI